MLSYPLGYSLLTCIGVRRERWPGGDDIRCVPLVQPGTLVEAAQPVMRVERLEIAKITSTVPRLSLPMSEIETPPGQVHTRAKISTIPAGLRGRVIAHSERGGVVIESLAALVAGTLGAGRQVAGPLTIWQAPGSMDCPPAMLSGSLLVVPGPLNLAILQQALNSGLGGVIASSISSSDLEVFLHADLIDLLNYSRPELLLAHLPPLTILLTEGLGTVAMPVRTIDLLTSFQGRTALLSGATSLSARIYPELVISLTEAEVKEATRPAGPDTELRPGALVRVCSGSYEGVIGVINYLFTHQQLFPSGVRERAARIQLEDGSLLVVPLPVLERIG